MPGKLKKDLSRITNLVNKGVIIKKPKKSVGTETTYLHFRKQYHDPFYS